VNNLLNAVRLTGIAFVNNCFGLRDGDDNTQRPLCRTTQISLLTEMSPVWTLLELWWSLW